MSMYDSKPLERLMQLRAGGRITSLEFESQVWACVRPEFEVEVLEALEAHPSAEVRESAPHFTNMLRNMHLSLDLPAIQQTSPLQQGVRMRLFGGYSWHADQGCPPWLQGREYWVARFAEFVPVGAGKIPAAFVQLEEEIDAGQGPRRCALLRSGPSNLSPAWMESEGTAVVHLVEKLPVNMRAFYADDPWPHPKALETHASYRVVGEGDAERAPM